MEAFRKLFASLLVFIYHCFDRVVINGYLSTGTTVPETSGCPAGTLAYLATGASGIPCTIGSS